MVAKSQFKCQHVTPGIILSPKLIKTISPVQIILETFCGLHLNTAKI